MQDIYNYNWNLTVFPPHLLGWKSTRRSFVFQYCAVDFDKSKKIPAWRTPTSVAVFPFTKSMMKEIWWLWHCKTKNKVKNVFQEPFCHYKTWLNYHFSTKLTNSNMELDVTYVLTFLIVSRIKTLRISFWIHPLLRFAEMKRLGKGEGTGYYKNRPRCQTCHDWKYTEESVKLNKLVKKQRENVAYHECSLAPCTNCPTM